MLIETSEFYYCYKPDPRYIAILFKIDFPDGKSDIGIWKWFIENEESKREVSVTSTNNREGNTITEKLGVDWELQGSTYTNKDIGSK